MYIISDLHLGSRHTNYSAISDFLSDHRKEHIIFAGDIFDDWTNPSEKIRQKIATIAKQMRSINADFIYGNHDPRWFKLISKPYIIVDKTLITHGHLFCKNKARGSLAQIGSWFYENLFLIDEKLANRAKALFKPHDNKLRYNLSNFAYTLGVDNVVFGHTHKPSIKIFTDNLWEGIVVANSGDWITHNSYIKVEQGHLSLEKYK